MHVWPGTGLLLLAFFLSIASPPVAAAVIFPDSVDDLCAPADDPCVIDDDVDVSDGPSVLDFGTRAVHFLPGTKLFVRNSTLTIHAGPLLLGQIGSVSIVLHGYVAPGVLLSGGLTINSYETCDDDPMQRCLSNADCAAGTCISVTPGFSALTIVGGIDGDGAEGASVTLRSAAGLALYVDANLSGSTEGGGGGHLHASAGRAPLWVQSRISSTGAYAGSLRFESGAGADIDSQIDISGRFGADDAVIDVIGDVKLNGRFDANAASSSGVSGGILSVSATGDISVGYGTLTFSAIKETPPRFRASLRGSTIDGSGGDVTMQSSAGRLELSGDVRLVVRGGKNQFSSGGSVMLHGATQTGLLGRVAAGAGGPGGLLSVSSDGSVVLGPSVKIDVGGVVTGGQVNVAAGGDVQSNASIRARAKDADGAAGVVSMSGQDVDARGKISVGGTSAADPAVELSGCDIFVVAKMKLGVTGDALKTISREQLTITADSSVNASAGAINSFEYRSDGPVPIVSGSVTPAPVLSPIALSACPP